MAAGSAVASDSASSKRSAVTTIKPIRMCGVSSANAFEDTPIDADERGAIGHLPVLNNADHTVDIRGFTDSLHLGIDVMCSAGDVIEGFGQGGDPLTGECRIEPGACV